MKTILATLLLVLAISCEDSDDNRADNPPPPPPPPTPWASSQSPANEQAKREVKKISDNAFGTIPVLLYQATHSKKQKHRIVLSYDDSTKTFQYADFHDWYQVGVVFSGFKFQSFLKPLLNGGGDNFILVPHLINCKTTMPISPDNCHLELIFDAKGKVGKYTTTVVIPFVAEKEGKKEFHIPIEAKVHPHAELEVSYFHSRTLLRFPLEEDTRPLYFGEAPLGASKGERPMRPVAIINVGKANATEVKIEIKGEHPGNFSYQYYGSYQNDCSRTGEIKGAHNRCSLRVYFDPANSTPGAKKAELIITYHNGATEGNPKRTRRIELTGEVLPQE